MTSPTYPFKSYDLHMPSLQEVASLFQDKLTGQYAEVKVSVGQCPDLKCKPFNLAASGLNGKPSVCDVGGVPYLVPLAQTQNAPYSMAEIGKMVGYSQSFLLGAACGPHHVVGTNSELMPNTWVKSTANGVEVIQNETHMAKLEDNEKGYSVKKMASNCDFTLLGNLFVSEGKAGQVIKVTAKKRLGKDNFISVLRAILNERYVEKEQHVAIGGVFLIKSGKAKLHVMPDFSKTPLITDEDVNNWLRYFEADATPSPLICLTVFHSQDSHLDLRLEHTHCFSEHGDGGHYHYDTTPDTVEYEAYLNVAERLHRIDPPATTHNVGRD